MDVAVYADIVKTINEHLKCVGVKYAFVGVSAPSTVNTLQGEDILKLNRMLKSVNGGESCHNRRHPPRPSGRHEGTRDSTPVHRRGRWIPVG